MNERIEKLAREAALAEGWGPGVWQTTFTEKFAELIVSECTKAVMDGTKEGDHYAQRIEQHFDNGTGGVLHFGIED